MLKSIVKFAAAFLFLFPLSVLAQTDQAWQLTGFAKPAFNPIMGADSSFTFFCPVKKEMVQWQKADVFNPAAIVRNGKVYILFRAEDIPGTAIGMRTSRIGLAKSKDGIPIQEVTRRIREQTGLGAFTAEEFGWKTIGWVLKNTGIGINFGTTILLGFIVGMAISGQTFYLFTVENLRQFGALKAMGASTFTLAKMILLQAFTVGLTGYGVGVGLATAFGYVTARGGSLPFIETWQLLLLVLVGLLTICTFSALISIVKLAKLEPAIVFR